MKNTLLNNLMMRYRERGRIWRVISLLPKILKTGTYYINFVNKEITKIKTKHSKKIEVIGNEDSFNFENISFNYGASKVLFLTDDICYACYRNKGFDYVANCHRNLDKLKYPIYKVFDIYSDKQIITFERVNGVEIHDDIHDDIVINYVVNALSKEKIVNMYDSYCQYQHTDLGRNNILWKDDNTFVCIDLDYADYAPLFTDIIVYYLKTSTPLDKFIEILNKYPKIKETVLKVFPSSENYIDDLLNNFIIGIYSNEYVRNLLRILEKVDLSSYPKAQKSFKERYTK